MMKILILGADGMLGHQLVESLSPRHALVGTVRLPVPHYAPVARWLPTTLHGGIDASDYAGVERVLKAERPHAVVNAIGIVKQRSESNDAIVSLEINALLPHRLAMSCRTLGARLVQVSTDCVFAGTRGNYRESDHPDAYDLYGRTKLLGEVTDEGAITLRTSMIGLELSRKSSLVEWFLAQRGPINGYRHAIYTGFTTLELSRIIELVLTSDASHHGVFQVASEPIDKYSLLCGLRDRIGHDIRITPNDDFRCDRSLEGSRFNATFDYKPPSWDAMLDELAANIKERYP